MKSFKIVFLLLTLCVLQVAATPKRIISLVPAATKSIILLGGDNLLVGCTNFCEQPTKRKVPVIASAIQVNMEKALVLKPDLVIVSSLINPETINSFKKMGVPVLEYTYAKSFNELCVQLQQIGNVIGKKTQADKLITDAKLRLKTVLTTVPKRNPKPKIFMEIGANPLFTVVPNTFMQDFINFAGCENIAGDLKMGSITRETVVARNPDVIFVVLMGNISKDEKSTWLNYKNLKASKNKKVFLLDDNKMCSPTPGIFVDALADMIKLIY